jgi:transposase
MRRLSVITYKTQKGKLLMQAYYTTLFVPLDIGKNVHWCAGYAGYDLKPVVEPFKVRSDRSGFEQVSGVIDGLLSSGEYDRVVLGHEPTGIYHQAWSRALYDRYAAHRTGQAQPQLDYQFLNPLLTKRQREQLARGRKRKTDAVDLRAMAFCLRDGQGQPAFVPTDQAVRFQLWGQAYDQTRQVLLRQTVQLISQLDRLWPGLVVNVNRFRQMHPDLAAPTPLVLSKPLERQRVRALLEHCPNPHDFLALGSDGIQAFYRSHIGRCGSATAQLAFYLVQNAVLPPPDIAALLAERLQADFAYFLSLEQRLDTLAAQAETLVPGSPAAVLDAIPGISPLLAARYLAHLGHPQRFVSAAQIWAFAGFDLVSQESGDFRRVGHISKKGDPGLRDTLYLIGLHTAQHLPAIAAAKQRALKRGLGQVGATLHAAQKANRLCHHLLYHQLPFDPQRLR